MKEHRTPFAIALILFAVLLPLAVWQGGVALLERGLERNPVPDQGGMVVVYLGYWLSVGVAVVIGMIGIVMLFRRRRVF